MRNFLVRAILAGVVGAATVALATAADIASGLSVGSNNGYYSAYGTRIEPVVIYDTEPGVIVRSYWYAPWANRHYFPKTGRRPKTGRVEHLTARHNSKAENYFRLWTASSGFPIYVPPTRASQFGIPPVQPMQ
jgi:hypothetical protein